MTLDKVRQLLDINDEALTLSEVLACVHAIEPPIPEHFASRCQWAKKRQPSHEKQHFYDL
jgi:hypothetical protein